MQNKLKVAVIGCGRMGMHHVKAISVVGVAELIGVADSQAVESVIRASLPATVKFYSDPAALLRELKPDIVHIVTPPETHVEMARLALVHGRDPATRFKKPSSATA